MADPISSKDRSYAYAAGSKVVSKKNGQTNLRDSATAPQASSVAWPTDRSFAQAAGGSRGNAIPIQQPESVAVGLQKPPKSYARYTDQQQALAAKAKAASPPPPLPPRNTHPAENKAVLERMVAEVDVSAHAQGHYGMMPKDHFATMVAECDVSAHAVGHYSLVRHLKDPKILQWIDQIPDETSWGPNRDLLNWIK